MLKATTTSPSRPASKRIATNAPRRVALPMRMHSERNVRLLVLRPVSAPTSGSIQTTVSAKPDGSSYSSKLNMQARSSSCLIL